MPSNSIRLTFKVYDNRLVDTVTHEVASQTTLESIVTQILQQMNLEGNLAQWELRHNGQVIGWHLTAGKVSAQVGSRDLLLYLDRSQPAKKKAKPETNRGGSSIPLLGAGDSGPAVPDLPVEEETAETDEALGGMDDSGLLFDDSDDDDMDLSEDDCELQEEGKESVDSCLQEFTETAVEFTEMAPSAEPSFAAAPSPPPAARRSRQRRVPVVERKKGKAAVSPAVADRPTAEKRVTVRYYDRMNPARVFPLLVTMTKEEIEEIQKKHVQQTSSGPVKMKLDVPVEIEPVLPGCTCHPPVVKTRLTQENYKFTFYVVPNVVGRVKGACVRVRQEETTLTNLDLTIRVVPRTLVIVGALLTFGLPFIGSLLRHFGLDFTSQANEGFTGYLLLAQVLFDRISPLGLTGILAGVTGGFWFATRPRQKSLFDSVNTVASLETQLETIQELRTAGKTTEAWQALVKLLNEHPTYQPALVSYGQWHYEEGDFPEALNGYRKALEVGPLPDLGDYIQLSAAAARAGKHEDALNWLLQGEAVHPHSSARGIAAFNRGCDLTHLKRYEEAIAALHEACDRGYVKLENYLSDSDLDPLRDREDFKRLLQRVEQDPWRSR